MGFDFSGIKAIFFDFDGVFTDNKVWVSEKGEEIVCCSRADGIGLQKLKNIGVYVGIVSTEVNPVVRKRAEKLGIDVWAGVTDKESTLKRIIKELGFSVNEVAFVGNDENDVDALNLVAFSIAVSDACPSVIKLCDFVTEKPGGQGAVREICEKIFADYHRKSNEFSKLTLIELAERGQPVFPESQSLGHRDWGTEDLLLLSPKKFSMKRIFIDAGHKGGFQYHRLKDEGGILLSGCLKIRYVDRDGALAEKVCNAGQVFHFPVGCVHQEEALTDCVILEVSTPHFNDRVRCDELVGESTEGLPSTSLNEIEFR